MFRLYIEYFDKYYLIELFILVLFFLSEFRIGKLSMKEGEERKGLWGRESFRKFI